MILTLFVFTTFVVGIFCQTFASHYLSLLGTSPQILLMSLVAIGFVVGPVTGVLLGFFWGLAIDSAGVHMFGMNGLLLSLAGYVSGSLRRRVACERNAAQLVVGLVSTLFYAFLAMFLFHWFEQSGGRFSLVQLVVRVVFNLLFVNILFYFVEKWVELWRLEKEYM